MLSPSATPPSTLVTTAYSLLDQRLSDWPKDTEESSFYGPLLDSLNDFFDASDHALDLSNPPIIERDARWHAGLRFAQLIGGICKTHSHEFGAERREVVSGVQNASQRLELAILVQLDEDRLAVVARALRSARVLWSACPMKKFGLVIGFQHTTLNLRFFIIRRGGMTAPKPLSIVEEHGKKHVLRVFFPILTWRSEEDTGVPKFFRDGLTINIPPGGC